MAAGRKTRGRAATGSTKGGSAAEPIFFADTAAWRKWLERNHASAQEAWVGFYRKGTGRPSMTWQEAVAEALCFGWIDGIRKSVDGESYTNRFTPRKPRSNWSAINIRTVEELIAAGRMAPAGLAAFEARDPSRTNRYSFEQEQAGLAPEHEKEMRRNRAAWRWFQAQAPYYRRVASWWVESAKREETRLRRLAVLIEDSGAGRRIPLLRREEK